MTYADISISQHSVGINEGNDYSWSVKEDGLYADECVGMTSGHSKKSVAAAMLDAVNSAISLGYKAVRITYIPVGGKCKSFDATIADGKFDFDRARKAADKFFA